MSIWNSFVDDIAGGKFEKKHINVNFLTSQDTHYWITFIHSLKIFLLPWRLWFKTNFGNLRIWSLPSVNFIFNSFFFNCCLISFVNKLHSIKAKLLTGGLLKDIASTENLEEVKNVKPLNSRSGRFTKFWDWGREGIFRWKNIKWLCDTLSPYSILVFVIWGLSSEQLYLYLTHFWRQCSHYIPPENILHPVFRGYKMGTLVRNGLQNQNFYETCLLN